MNHTMDAREQKADELLRDFFRSELPSRWPAAPLPTAVATPLALPTGSRWRPRSLARLALAASLVVLVGGASLLTSAFRPIEMPAPLDGISTAQPPIKFKGAAPGAGEKGKERPMTR